ncbi:Protein of unknown function [Gryllus bimaculatus]|nr:Protein of unknown function [Gryllus bimaculatus]
MRERFLRGRRGGGSCVRAVAAAAAANLAHWPCKRGAVLRCAPPSARPGRVQALSPARRCVVAQRLPGDGRRRRRRLDRTHHRRRPLACARASRLCVDCCRAVLLCAGPVSELTETCDVNTRDALRCPSARARGDDASSRSRSPRPQRRRPRPGPGPGPGPGPRGAPTMRHGGHRALALGEFRTQQRPFKLMFVKCSGDPALFLTTCRNIALAIDFSLRAPLPHYIYIIFILKQMCEITQYNFANITKRFICNFKLMKKYL